MIWSGGGAIRVGEVQSIVRGNIMALFDFEMFYFVCEPVTRMYNNLKLLQSSRKTVSHGENHFAA